MLGYCLFPLNVVSFITMLVGRFIPSPIKLILVVLSFMWATLCKYGINKHQSRLWGNWCQREKGSWPFIRCAYSICSWAGLCWLFDVLGYFYLTPAAALILSLWLAWYWLFERIKQVGNNSVILSCLNNLMISRNSRLVAIFFIATCFFSLSHAADILSK